MEDAFMVGIYFILISFLILRNWDCIQNASFYHARYLSNLALQVRSSNWVHKTRINSIQRWRHFGTKTSWSAFLLETWLYSLSYWIRYSWSGSTHILYYINLWNTLLINQILLCQQVFYYNFLCNLFKGLIS